MQIHFDSPKSFAEFAVRHAIGADGKPEIFVETALFNERNGGNSPWEERFTFERYTTVANVHNTLMRAFMASLPQLPQGWRLLADKKAGIAFHSKQELLSYMKRIGASPDKVKQLTKMKAQELKEFLDTSDENATEFTERSEKKSDALTLDVSGLKLINSVTCELKHGGSHGYGNAAYYIISADVSAQWSEKEKEIAESINEDKFIIYRGHVDEGSRGY